MIILLYHQVPREFQAKLFASHQLASRFGAVILARTSALERVLQTVPGHHAIVEIGLTPARAQRFINLRARGHMTLAFDEEATGAQKIRDYRQFALGPLGPDYVLLLGRLHRQQLNSHLRNHAQASCVIGHPRFDVMRPMFRDFFQDEAPTPRPYSLHVLKPTNIAPGDERSAFRREVARIQKKQALAHRLQASLGGHIKVNFRIPSWSEFRSEAQDRLSDLAVQIEVARSLRDEFGLRPILRPRLEVKADVLVRQLSSVGLRPQELLTMRINRRSSLAGLIHGAHCVVQFGCTSAIESSIAQKTLLHIDAPHRNFAKQSEVTRELGIRVANGEQAAQALAQAQNEAPARSQSLDCVQVADLSIARMETMILNDAHLCRLAESFAPPVGRLSQSVSAKSRGWLRDASSWTRSANHAPASPSMALQGMSWLDAQFNSKSSLQPIERDAFLIRETSSCDGVWRAGVHAEHE